MTTETKNKETKKINVNLHYIELSNTNRYNKVFVVYDSIKITGKQIIINKGMVYDSISDIRYQHTPLAVGDELKYSLNDYDVKGFDTIEIEIDDPIEKLTEAFMDEFSEYFTKKAEENEPTESDEKDDDSISF